MSDLVGCGKDLGLAFSIECEGTSHHVSSSMYGQMD